MTGAYTLLRRQMGGYYLLATTAAAAVAVVVGLSDGTSPVDGVVCGTVCFLLVTIEAAMLRRGLALNTKPTGELYAGLGLANCITLFRGWLIAVTAGVLTLQGTGALPTSGEAVAWVPALLYTFALILDAVDGSVARKTSSVTPLGRYLENEYDSLGVLILAFFLSVTGRAYPLIALVGIARYLFVFGMWVRRRLGLKTHPLSHSKSGKIIAGLMMGYLSAGLWPVFSTKYVSIAGIIFFVPFAAGFLRDWLAVCGRIDLYGTRYRRIAEWLTRTALESLPVLLRVIAAGLLVWLSTFPEVRIVVSVSAAVLLFLGVGGRVAAIVTVTAIAAGVLIPGLEISSASPVAGLEVAVFVAVLIIFLCGTGHFSLWQPEEKLFRKKQRLS